MVPTVSTAYNSRQGGGYAQRLPPADLFAQRTIAIGMLTSGYRPAIGAMIDALPPLENANKIVRFPSASVKPTAAARNHVRADIPLGKGS